MTPTRRITTPVGVTAVRHSGDEGWAFTTARMSWRWCEQSGTLYWHHLKYGNANVAAEYVPSLEQATAYAAGWDAGAMWWQDGGRDVEEIGGGE